MRAVPSIASRAAHLVLVCAGSCDRLTVMAPA